LSLKRRSAVGKRRRAARCGRQGGANKRHKKQNITYTKGNPRADGHYAGVAFFVLVAADGKFFLKDIL
jgi:hypothetical protein